ncbi:tail assembly chaperone [Staphylococcus hsinchuensis]|uniref:Tail assembly chaperone n=1 Tax=Staphylococcus hsinchuensis TaxID=3051183 RepID=A0ABZ3E9U8_9STAP
MEIKFKGRTYKLSFGFRFINEIDRTNGTNIEHDGQSINFGNGLEMIVPMLQNASIAHIGRVILAATSHYKQQAPTIDDLDEILNDIAENQGLQAFADEVIEELGKQPMTQNLVKQATEVEEEPKKKDKKEK